MSDLSPVKLLVVTPYFEGHRGGVEIVAGTLGRELSRLGLSIVWLASDAAPPPDPSTGAGRAVAVRASNIAERAFGIPLPLPAPSAILAVWREVKACDAVLIHDSINPGSVVARLFARLAGKPVVIVQHVGAVPYRNPLFRHLMRIGNALVARPMLAGADQVVFISETTRAYFSGVRFKSPPKTIFNGVDTDVFRPLEDLTAKQRLREALDLPHHRPVALFVGRFVEKKGLDIIETMARHAPDITFALAGWGPLAPGRWGLANISVLGGLSGSSLAQLYRASDAFVLPSTGEGLPLVIQEALACGLPVVCSAEISEADPELAAMVEGVKIDPADTATTAAGFTAALRRVLAQPNPLAQAMDRFARVSIRYDWASAAAAYRDIIETLVTARLSRQMRRPVTAR